MKAAELTAKLKSQGREATRLDSATVAVRVPQERLYRESAALLRETGWKTVGEYDPATGACRVVLRDVASAESK